MKHYLFFALLFCSNFGALAQMNAIYFAGEKITTDKAKATSYAVYGKLSNEELWVFKRFDLNDNLIQTGSYRNEMLSIPHGKFVFYMDIEAFNNLHQTNFKFRGITRFVSQEGNFVNGHEEGKWLFYYPDGNILSIQHFKNGKLDGEFINYDKFGRIIIKGNYLNGEKDGEWIFDKGKKKAIYEKGELKSSTDTNKKKQ